MNRDARFDGGCFASAVSRLGRLVEAVNRINTDLAVLPDDATQDENDAMVSAIYESVLGELSIPLNVYCDSYPGFSQSDTKLLMRSMRKWSASYRWISSKTFPEAPISTGATPSLAFRSGSYLRRSNKNC